MCTAGDSLLYSWGRNITGDGQFRKCRKWSALRDWATENSACYRDSVDSIRLNEHFLLLKDRSCMIVVVERVNQALP